METTQEAHVARREIADLPVATVSRLGNTPDLNQHGPLVAGGIAGTAVETAFVGAQKVLAIDPRHIVCIRMHGLTFTRPVRNGAVIDIRARAAHVGKSSLTMYIETLAGGDNSLLDGFITFVHVSEEGRACPHGLAVAKPASGPSLALWKHVEDLRERSG